ncbi:hypothetical protein SAZ11_29375 [Streptomyces sp. FXJ1.4098]|nr:hypothetical protein [Streptomyces sp. FXJ1.4098]
MAGAVRSRTPDVRKAAEARREARKDAATRAADKKPAGASSSAGARKDPGTLGKMVLARQARKNDDAKAARRADADRRKADLADRASARKQATKDADTERARTAAKDKARRGRSGKPDGTKKHGKDDGVPKVDLTKTPKNDNDKGDLPKASKSGKKPRPSSSHTPAASPAAGHGGAGPRRATQSPAQRSAGRLARLRQLACMGRQLVPAVRAAPMASSARRTRHALTASGCVRRPAGRSATP